MKKKTRRFLLLVILITVFSAFSPLVKLLICLPMLILLLVEWDAFTLENNRKIEGVN
ncbi:hypothetical protein ACYSNO_10845 [Enterococcus sp. LJL98]